MSWVGANRYFEGLDDPYRQFVFRVPDGQGGFRTVSKSTSEIMFIQQSGYQGAQNELRSMLDSLINNGILSDTNPWGQQGGAQCPNAYRHLMEPEKLLTAYPFTNDCYMPDSTVRIEGMAVPKGVKPVYVTAKVFDRNAVTDEFIMTFCTEILTYVRLLHGSANANAMMSPAVSIALNRIGYTETMFVAMDKTASMPLVPKLSTGRPQSEVLRGAWSDNRFFGSPDAGVIYSNKNAYLPNLGAPDRTIIPDIYRDGPMGASTTRYVNPTFPEFFRPMHFARIADSGSAADAGFMIEGVSSQPWRWSLRNRRPLWTIADQATIEPRGDGMMYVTMDHTAFSSGGGGSLSDLLLGQRLDSVAGIGTPDERIRRLRDWYYAYKTKDEIRYHDAITDFATLCQLAEFLSTVPPHVLLHSVMGYHNALLRLSFDFVGQPFSTNLSEYQANMRIEREGIAELSAGLEVAGDSRVPGYGLTVKAPDLVAWDNADLRGATVASLQIAIATCAANPIAGVVCLALVGCAVLVAELTGGRTQELITPRDRSREDIRDKRNGGIRSNWFRGYTPEYVVNASPVLRIR